MHRYFVYLAAGAVVLSGATVFSLGNAAAASVSERICQADGGTWDQSTKTCTYPVVETKPGNNNGNAKWETEESDVAHGNLKNSKSQNFSSCDGPGSSESKC